MADMERLRSVMEELAAIDRASASPGELEAARLIAEAFEKRGAIATLEQESLHGTYWWPLGITSGLGILAGLLGRRGRRYAGALLGLAGALLAADDLSVGRRPLRNLLWKRQSANVVAETGDLEAENKLVLVSHHDAAHTGFFFNPKITEIASSFLDRGAGQPSRQPALMAPIVVAPGLAGLAALFGRRRIAGLAALACGGIIATFVEMALRETVPGANDNLTGVITLLGVAEGLQDEPVRGLKVILVSTGSEEALMEGMVAFAKRHGRELDPASTRLICVDTVGSPYLVLPEGEGMVRMRLYDDEMKSLLASLAAERGIELRRGMKVRLGTDGYVALRDKIPAAMLMSLDEGGTSSNYHWPTDVPERVDYRRLGDAISLCEAAVRSLASRLGG